MLTVIKSLAVLAVVVFGLTLGRTDGPVGPQAEGLQSAALGGFLTALVAALWAYDGWTAGVTFVGSEVAEPKKNISRALVWGVLFVGGMYILANIVYFSVLSLGEVAQSEHVASDVVEQFAGLGAAQWITLAMVISALGTLNSTILSGARVPYAMGRDGLFFNFAARIHPTYRVPGHSLWFQAALGCLFALTGTFEELFSLVIFAAWIFYGLTVAAMFQLRRKEPEMERPLSHLGLPVGPGLVRHRRPGSHRKPVAGASGAVLDRAIADTLRAAVLLALAENAARRALTVFARQSYDSCLGFWRKALTDGVLPQAFCPRVFCQSFLQMHISLR